MKRSPTWALALALLAPAPAAAALICSLDGVVPVSFGAYDALGRAAVDSTGSVTFTCSGATASDQIGVEISAGGAGSFAPRRLQAGLSTLDYNLFLDAARQSIWGDGSGATLRYTLGGTALNATHVIPIYGRVFSGQNPTVGAYTDSLTVTLSY